MNQETNLNEGTALNEGAALQQQSEDHDAGGVNPDTGLWRFRLGHRLLVVAVMCSVVVATMRNSLSDGLERLDERSERGEVSSTTVMIAILVALAIVVGGIITTKITAKANSIDPG